MLRKIVKLITILFILLVAFLIVGHTHKEESKPEKLSIYRGNLDDYHVIIEDVMRDSIYQRTVSLDLISDKEILFKPILIIGHYNADNGQFEEIFIRQKEQNGYNFTRSKDGWTWKTYPGDKDKTSPFSFKQISEAQEKLYLATARIYNAKHLYSTFETKRH